VILHDVFSGFIKCREYSE